MRSDRYHALRKSRLVRIADALNDFAWFSRAPRWLTSASLRVSFWLYEQTGVT